MSVPHVDSKKFNAVISKLRSFFLERKGFLETHTQNRLSILAACENPKSISCFQYAGQKWPLAQTNQMWLEDEILKYPDNNYFCVTTSYREEKEPIEGRHDLIFPMGEFEARGNFQDLLTTLRELLEHLGYGPADSFPTGTYASICEKYGVTDIDHDVEQMIYRDFGPVFLLTHFPEETSPFFNMRRLEDGSGLSYKCDVIMSGMETIGSAERSSDVKDMLHRFETISDGEYASTLYGHFGKERVMKELNEYFSYDFFSRYGAGIGLTRLIKSMEREGLI